MELILPLKGFRTTRFVLTLFLLVLTIVNYKLYRERKSEELKYADTSLAEIYFPSEESRLNINRIDEDKIKILIHDESCNKWSLFNEYRPIMDKDNNPILSLLKGEHKYTFICQDERVINITLAYFPPEIYQQAEHQVKSGVIQLIKSSAPIGEFRQYPLNEWIPYYSDQELSEAKKILKNVVKEGDGTEEKIKKINKFLLDIMDTKRGVPSTELDKLSPFKQYEALINGKGKVWCSNISSMYIFFANAAGVTSRPVGLGGALNGISLSGHSVAESYFPEFNKWAYVDVTSKKILVKNAFNEPLNVVELYWALNSGNSSSLTVVTYNGKDFLDINYAKTAYSGDIYFHRDTILYFPLKRLETKSFFKKMYVYLFRPDLKISIYSNLKGSVHLNAVRLFLAWIVILISNILYWVAFGLLHLARRRYPSSHS